jgi:hypothetical protein
MTSVKATRLALQEIRVKQQSLHIKDLWIQQQRKTPSVLNPWRLEQAEREQLALLEQAAREQLELLELLEQVVREQFEEAVRELFEEAKRKLLELFEQVARKQLELFEQAARKQLELLEQAAREQLEQAEREQLEHERIARLWRSLEYLALLLLSILRFLLSCNKFGGFQNRERPRCTTMPWNIWPSLVVLWGVCWMFINTPFVEFNATKFNSAFDDEQLPLFVPSKTFPSTREIFQLH